MTRDRAPNLPPTEPDPRASTESARSGSGRDRATEAGLGGFGGAPWEGPSAGTVIDGTYRVVGPLGQGGMGVVVLAMDQRLEREVAVKFIRPAYLRSRKARVRFLTEARSMARVRHENVVEIYAFGEINEIPYFVMENVPGSTVALWLRAAARSDAMPPVDEALGLLDQVCKGLKAVHDSGTVHGDLKPNNVLIGPASRVAIADLGMSRALGPREDGEINIGGTPAYMAPELLGNEIPPELLHRADVYALGVMAYEMLTGEAPYEVNCLEDLTRVREMEIKPPSEIRGELPAGFDAVLLDAVRPDPARRTPSADDFRRALLEARESMDLSYDRLRILIADDDPAFAALARETLSFSLPGARLECVADGEAALRAIDREAASLAVIDLDMPGMNGVELTAALRAEKRTRSMPIIVVTAAGGAPDWTLLSSLGADGFLVKPIDPFSLVALARKTLGVRAT
jgi:serine/threonine-protein kinase